MKLGIVAVFAGMLPRDAASAMVQQVVADAQPRDAAAALLAKPKPKARVRGPAPTAAEAAAAAAAAATLGLNIAPAPGKQSKKKNAAVQGSAHILIVLCCVVARPSLNYVACITSAAVYSHGLA